MLYLIYTLPLAVIIPLAIGGLLIHGMESDLEGY